MLAGAGWELVGMAMRWVGVGLTGVSDVNDLLQLPLELRADRGTLAFSMKSERFISPSQWFIDHLLKDFSQSHPKTLKLNCGCPHPFIPSQPHATNADTSHSQSSPSNSPTASSHPSSP